MCAMPVPSLLLHLLLPVAAGQKYVPNLGYAFSGYNIFRANPLATDPLPLDPGFLNPVFDAKYSGKTTDDQRYFVPDGVTIRQALSCNIEKSDASVVSKSTSDYQSSLSAKAAGQKTFGFFSASFSASVDYKTVHDRTKARSNRIVSKTAECSVYQILMEPALPPNMTADFVAFLNTLPEDYDDGSKYFDLFEKYGTHVITETTMGARYGFSSVLNESSWNVVESTGISVSAAAALHAFVQAGGTLSDDTEKHAEAMFAVNQQSSKEISLGSKPSGGDADKWAQQSFDEPMPILYKLKPICDLLPDATSKPPSNKQHNCWTAAADSEYCQKQLKVKGDVASFCSGQSPLAFVKFDRDNCPNHVANGAHALQPCEWSPCTWVDHVDGTLIDWGNTWCGLPDPAVSWNYGPDETKYYDVVLCKTTVSNTDPTAAENKWGSGCRLIETEGCMKDDDCNSTSKCNSHYQCAPDNNSSVSDHGQEHPLISEDLEAKVLV